MGIWNRAGGIARGAFTSPPQTITNLRIAPPTKIETNLKPETQFLYVLMTFSKIKYLDQDKIDLCSSLILEFVKAKNIKVVELE